MVREDLRSRIIPASIGNTDKSQKMGNKKFNTTDLIYLDSYAEQYGGKKTDEERRISATDYAQMNYAYIHDNDNTRTRIGRPTTNVWLRSAYNDSDIYYVYRDGDWRCAFANSTSIGIRPCLHYSFPPDISKRGILGFLRGNQKGGNEVTFDIREVKDTKGKTIYHTLQIAEYTKTKVDKSLSGTLESLYHGGKIKEGILCTGRWYSCNGQKEGHKAYAGKHSPEFEYEGNRYVRVISYPNRDSYRYSDGTIAGEIGTVRWVKVEPISFIIKNWNEMPKSINPKGTGKAKYFDLIAEEAIIANIPFYPVEDGKNRTMWQNSCIRGFLNGIDVRSITQNGVPEYGAIGGGNFTGECNFLNEAFNLSRQPMIVYTIPDSEMEIPDDAFNGCISLKKLVMHSGIKTIGKRAFDGLDFKYAYRTRTGELIFSQELPKNKEEYTDVIEVGEIAKSLVGFDYNILIPRDKLDEIDKFSETLRKNKFSIPYVYGLALVESGKVKSFCENSDFRFFKNEIPNINDILLNFPEEERLDFFKFATSLGCFRAEKMLDKRGKETEVILAQKATSLLAKVLKKEEMELRQISWIIQFNAT